MPEPIEAVLALSLAAPGSGETPDRFRAMWKLAAQSPSLGRLGEAHHDALAILGESGRPRAEVMTLDLHGVWAAGGPDPLELRRSGSTWRLVGAKHWCTGATLVRHALVTAECRDERRRVEPTGVETGGAGGALVLVDVHRPGVQPRPPEWQSPAFESIDTRTVDFDITVDDDAVVGVDDWYLNRPGFWHGAIGVAACWAGCVDGIVSRLKPGWRDDPHALSHLGAIDALLWNLRTVIDTAAVQIDADPIGTASSRQRLALQVRHIVDASVGEIITRITRALGPGPAAHSRDVHLHLAETDLYRRQCHAERDLDALGRLVIDIERRTSSVGSEAPRL